MMIPQPTQFSKLKKCWCCGRVYGLPKITGPACRCKKTLQCQVCHKCARCCHGHTAQEFLTANHGTQEAR